MCCPGHRTFDQFGVPNALADPVLELHGPAGFTTVTNDNWQDDPAQAAAILATGLAPTNNLESAIDATLNPGAYTAVVRGKNNTTGVGLIEVYDLSQAVLAKLANISTRAFVNTGNDIVIAGFILGGNSGNDRIVVRGIGPSLTAFGVPNALANPTLELRDNNGALLISNNDWQDDPAQAAELTAAGLAPTDPLESGIAINVAAGSLHRTARGTLTTPPVSAWSKSTIAARRNTLQSSHCSGVGRVNDPACSNHSCERNGTISHSVVRSQSDRFLNCS